MISFLLYPVNVYAQKKESVPVTNERLEEIIQDIITWAKQGNDALLNSIFLESAGQTSGDWFPIGIGRYGYKEEPYEPYLKQITEVVTERYKQPNKLHAVKATEWHRISLAVLAMGGDPTNIGLDTEGNRINLIADGSYNFAGRKGIDGQGINGAIWALICVDSLDYPIPDNARYQRDDIITLITKRQLKDGGFALAGIKSDPDITGMALQALAPYVNSNKKYLAYQEEKTISQIVEESLNILSQLQEKDGDFTSWGTVNVESTVQVLTALCSLGIDPYKDSRFIKYNNTLIDGILKYRCDDGGFAHSYQTDKDNPYAQAGISNGMATEQTLYGLVSYYRLKNGMRSLYDFRPEKRLEEKVTEEKKTEEKKADEKKTEDKKAEDKKTKAEEKKNSNNKNEDIKKTESSKKAEPGKKTESSKQTEASKNIESGKNKAPSQKENIDSQRSDKSDGIKTTTLTQNEKKASSAQIYEDIIPQIAFEEGKGTDKIISGTSKEKEGLTDCTISFCGTDINKPMDFKVGIRNQTKHLDEILHLSKDALGVQLIHEGELPGEALIEFSTDLEQGEYLVFTYDAQMKKANYHSKIRIEDKRARFIIKENEEYFIAKGANMSSLLEEDPIFDYNKEIESLNKEIEFLKKYETRLDTKLDTILELSKEYKQQQKELEKNSQKNTLILSLSVLIGSGFIGSSILIKTKKKNEDKERKN